MLKKIGLKNGAIILIFNRTNFTFFINVIDIKAQYEKKIKCSNFRYWQYRR